MKTKEVCQFFPITSETDTGSRNNCNYKERVGNVCYYANLDQTEKDWCNCAYGTPGRSEWGDPNESSGGTDSFDDPDGSW